VRRVSQIITYGTMAAKAAVRDVGRVLDLSYTFCDGISKLIPNKPGVAVTLQTPPKDKKKDDKYVYALEAEPLLAERERKEEDVRTLLELARKLEGVTRNVGMHAGGVLIAPGKLTDFCPLYMQPGSDAAVSQYDKDDVEAIGLVKFDFLGLATLTILELAKEFITTRYADQKDFAFERLPLDDTKVYELFGSGYTEAVFQFESRGMQGMLREAKPNRLEDLIAMNALYRPGPMELIPTYIARKHGRERPEYPDPRVEAILSETYGIMVYQEQVMQTAQILGGYSLGGADLLRRAMGKKKKEEMDAQRATFRAGAAENGLSQQKADEVFDLMEKFAGYGFNKSHSAAYALLAYHTAWLKVHYPAEFFAANMTIELDDTDKLKVLFDDARRMGISFTSPDVNEGTYRFEPVAANAVRYALGAVKGTGQGAVEEIVRARAEGGPFRSLFDFCVRVDRATVNKKAVEALIKAGAFDSVHGLDARPALLASLPTAFEHANTKEANRNQGGLFDMDGPADSVSAEPPLELATPWSVRERLTLEKTAVGFYLSGHLFDEYAHEVRRFAKRSLEDLLDNREPQVLAGIVSDARVVNVANGRMLIFRLDDKSRAIECIVRGNNADELRDLIKDDALVVVQAKLQPDKFNGESLAVQQAWDLAGARCRFGKFLRVAVNGQGEQFVPPFSQVLKSHPPRRLLTPQGELAQGMDIRVAYHTGQESCEIDFPGGAVRFFPSDDALQAWKQAAHEARADIVYE
jgi:DNA polymerase III subunit alpha